MDYTEKSPIILSLCPGMRGLERGSDRAFERIGWKSCRTAAYVEIEAFIIENLVQQMEQGVLDAAPIHSNIKAFPWEILRGRIDFIFGGYPCQPFSVAGKQKGIEDPRHLWPYIKKGIKTIMPLGCFFENVPGHINIGYREVKSDLEELGYTVKEGIYSAEEVGAPQQRKRLFILAILANANNGSLLNITRGHEKPSKSQKLQQWNKDKEFSISGKLANTHNSGSQGRNSRELSERTSELFIGSSDSWPARPGQQQYEWERHRTKSRMGFTINGYNYREDLLRMAGNGVVEQTAELAMLDLLNKIRNGTTT